MYQIGRISALILIFSLGTQVAWADFSEEFIQRVLRTIAESTWYSIKHLEPNGDTPSSQLFVEGVQEEARFVLEKYIQEGLFDWDRERISTELDSLALDSAIYRDAYGWEDAIRADLAAAVIMAVLYQRGLDLPLEAQKASPLTRIVADYVRRRTLYLDEHDMIPDLGETRWEFFRGIMSMRCLPFFSRPLPVYEEVW